VVISAGDVGVVLRIIFRLSVGLEIGAEVEGFIVLGDD
jgi:hypothetical protein